MLSRMPRPRSWRMAMMGTLLLMTGVLASVLLDGVIQTIGVAGSALSLWALLEVRSLVRSAGRP